MGTHTTINRGGENLLAEALVSVIILFFVGIFVEGSNNDNVSARHQKTEQLPFCKHALSAIQNIALHDKAASAL